MFHILKAVFALSILSNIALAQNFSDLPISQITQKSKFKFDKQIVLQAGEVGKVFCSYKNITIWSTKLSKSINCSVRGAYYSTEEYEHATAVPQTVEVIGILSETNRNDGLTADRRLTYKIGEHQQLEYQFFCGGYLKSNPDLINEISAKLLGSECGVEISPYVQILDLGQPATRVGENLHPCAEVSDRSRNADQDAAASDSAESSINTATNSSLR